MPYHIVPTTLSRLSLPLAVLLLLCLSLSAAQGADASDPRLDGSVTGGGLRAFVEGRWGLARGTVSNPSPEGRTFSVMLHFRGRGERQFVADTWVPGESKRRVVWPVRLVPDARGMNENSVEVRGLLYADDSYSVSLDEQPGTLLVTPDTDMSVMMSDPIDEPEARTMVAARLAMGMGKRATYTADRHAPQYALGWDAASNVMLATDQPDLDAAQRQALRRWLRGGGTLCVFADQVSSQSMRLLLADQWGVSVVDHVTLSSVRYEPTASPLLRRHRGRATKPYGPLKVERPVRMARVIAPEYETLLTVRGWPALMTRSVGAGRIVVVTLEGRAWNSPQTIGALSDMADAVLRTDRTNVARVPAEASHRFVSNKVGRPVVPKPFIGWALGLFAAAILLVGLVMRQMGRLEWLGPVAAVMSLLVVGVLLAAGRMQRGGAGPTDAALQLVQMDAGSRRAAVSGAVGLYAPITRQVTLSSDEGGWAWPGARRSEPQRLVWQGLDRWQWDEIEIAERTMHIADYASSSCFDHPLRTSVAFGSQGLEGTVEWPNDAARQDLLIATPRGNLLVTPLSVDGRTMRFAVGNDDVLNRGSYFQAGLLSQRRQDRALVLDGLFRREGWPAGPTLIGWSSGVPMGLEVSGDAAELHNSVWAIPLTIEPTRPGGPARVPEPFIELTVSRENLGLPAMNLYNERAGEWYLKEGTSQPSAFVGRFMLPTSVLPLRLTEATLKMDLTAINRPVRIVVSDNGRAHEVKTINGPDGRIEVALPVERMKVDAGGGVLVGFDVGRPDGVDQMDVNQSMMWRVRRMSLNVAGVVTE